MKKLLKVALVAVCVVFMSNFAKAQTKIGYINVDQVVQLMPQLKTIQSQIQAYSKDYSDNLGRQQAEFQKQVNDYNAKKATMSDANRLAKEAELGDMQKRMQDYTTTAQQQVEAKGQELAKPMNDQIHAAISAVAKEKGYTYVLNSAQTELLVAPDADDLMAAVKLKLGLK